MSYSKSSNRNSDGVALNERDTQRECERERERVVRVNHVSTRNFTA